MAVVRVTGRTRTVATRAARVVVRLTLHDNAITAIMMAVNEQREDEGKEEHDAVPISC